MIRWSRLSRLAQSAAHYAVEREDTEAMALGRLVHTLVLQPELSVPVAPKLDRRTKAGKEAFAALPPNAVAADVYDTACRMRDAVLAHPDAAALLLICPLREHEIAWSDGLHQFGGRIDAAGPRTILDLKTARDASPRGFGREVAARLYYGQLAWYQDGYGGGAECYLIAVESSAPYAVGVYQLSADYLRAGRRLADELLARLDDYEVDSARQVALGYGTHTLDCPAWLSERTEDHGWTETT